MDADYLLGCDVLGMEVVKNPDIGQPAVYIQGGGHGGGGHHGGGGRHRGGGRRRGAPAFWGGPWYDGPSYDIIDIVDDSEALRCVKYDAEGKCLEYVPTDILGDELDSFVVGMFDIGAQQRKMNTIKEVPVSVALALLKGGQDAINHARSIGKDRSLPGGTARDEVYWKLQWHQGALAPFIGDKNAIYPSGADLKNWTMRAFVESNAADEGAAWIDAAWSTMWMEIERAIAALPKKVAKAVGDVASTIVESTTGLPIWVWALIGTGAATLLGVVTWKVANSRAGVALIHGYAGRR